MRYEGIRMTRETDHQIQEYIEYLLQNSDAEHPMWNKELVRSGKQNKWNYILFANTYIY